MLEGTAAGAGLCAWKESVGSAQSPLRLSTALSGDGLESWVSSVTEAHPTSSTGAHSRALPLPCKAPLEL